MEETSESIDHSSALVRSTLLNSAQIRLHYLPFGPYARSAGPTIGLLPRSELCMSPSSQFLYTLCTPGSEALLKAEIAHHAPELHLAFSQPGFITWKRATGACSLDALPTLTFARRVGLSLGRASDVDGLLPLLAPLRGPIRLVVVPQTLHPWGHPSEEDAWQAASTLEAQLRADPRLTSVCQNISGRAEPGECVVELFIPTPRSGKAKHPRRHDDETPPPWWVGVFFLPHPGLGKQLCPFPGAVWPLSAPDNAPSRAWYKLEEARHTFAIPFQPGDVALELGSAPGGATRALLGLGVSVVGVDPDLMDPKVVAFQGPARARLTHIRSNISELRTEDLPNRIDWILLDVNLAPQLTLHALHRLADRLRDGLMGMLLTLHLNEPELVVALPELLRRVKSMGISVPLTTHLLANRQEVCVYGLTERGQRLRAIPPEVLMNTTRPR